MNYYIQGDPAKADQIRAAFEELGCDTEDLGFTSSHLYYTIEGRVELVCTKSLQNLIKTHPDYKELELPAKPHYDIANFKPFDKVLIRVGNKSKWTCDFFSYYHKGFHCIGTDDWSQCIPYNDDTKHLLGTADMCDEQYINW